jgi:glycosyltransferase involved in cell wall biosynthesis
VVNWQDKENPKAGGAEIHLHEVFGGLARRGHDVTLLVSGWSGSEPHLILDGMDVHRTGGRHSFSLAAPRYFRSRLAKRAFDVVVEDLNKVPVFTPCWGDANVLLLVHHLFGRTAFEQASPPVAAATWLLERTVPRVYRGLPVVAVSESTRRDLVSRGMDPQLIEVIPNGIDLAAFSPAPARGRFDTPTLLYLGRLQRYKRVDLILEAAARLLAGGHALRVVIAGHGDQAPALRTLARRLGIEAQVDFRGRVTDEERLDLFRRSWVHVLTSPNEGWGIANVEAAACGTPTVASDSPGLRESVVDGVTGYLVPHGDVAALAERTGSILRDETLRERLGQGARRFAEGYSWEASIGAMEAALTRAVRW